MTAVKRICGGITRMRVGVTEKRLASNAGRGKRNRGHLLFRRRPRLIMSVGKSRLSVIKRRIGMGE